MNTTGRDDMGIGTYDVNARDTAYDETMRSGEAIRTGAYADSLSDDETGRGATTLAAVFADRDAAHDAVHRLHDEGFRETWIGLTRRDDSGGYTAPSDYAVSGNGTAPSDLIAPNDNTSSAADAAARDYGTATARSGYLDDATSDQTRVEADNWFARFFGEGDESLHDALVRHGVNETDARSAGSLPNGSAIVTVDGANHPELAAQIVTQSGGRLITRGFGATGYGTGGAFGATAADLTSAPVAPAAAVTTTAAAYDASSAEPSTLRGLDAERMGANAGNANDDLGLTDRPDPVTARSSADPLTTTNAAMDRSMRDPELATTSYAAGESLTPTDAGATSYDDYGRYRAGTPIDESTRLQLREERLRVDKSRVSRGEATVGTEVVTETHDIDVPFIREELFVERRPSNGGAADTSTPFGSGEVIRVPLTEEQVSVQKIPVITEEVLVGKRQVEDTQHISETTRKEKLNVADVDAAQAGSVRDARS